MKKISEILLIDDSKGINSINKRLLLNMDIAENVTTALNGEVALNYLTTKNTLGQFPNPEIIFLDINMPVMDGYQFLEEYSKIEDNLKSNRIIIMLTSSISEIDMNKAKNYKTIKGYQFKPLNKEKIEDIFNQTF